MAGGPVGRWAGRAGWTLAFRPVSEPSRDQGQPPPGWLPEKEFHAIYARVPRLCVEVVVVEPERGVLLLLRDIPPNVGAWHIPGGTVLWGERLQDAVRRVARRELDADVVPGELLGTIEYPSHYENCIDSPVGIAFRCELVGDGAEQTEGARFFATLPDGLYAEQRTFLAEHFAGELSA